MFLVMLVPAFVYGGLALRLPESPRYLVEIGKYDEADAVLKQVYTDGTENLLNDIKASLDSEHRPKLGDLRGKRFGLLPIVWVGIILSALQQFVGINAVFYYSTPSGKPLVSPRIRRSRRR
jgi:SP family sugar:H+ symporter-like MFS transporter